MFNRVFPNTSAFIKFYFFLTALYYILDFFIPLAARNSTFMLLQGIPIVIGVVYLLAYLGGSQKNTFSLLLFFFIGIMVVSALFSPYFNPNCLYILRNLLTYYIFYVAASKNKISEKSIISFALFLFLYSIISTVVTQQVYSEEYEDLTLGSNAGYTFVACMTLFSLNLMNKRNILLYILCFLGVLLSFKRGAIISALPLALLFLFNLNRMTKSKTAIAVFVSIFFVGIIMVPILKDSLIDRFSHLETSGRDVFYRILWNGWLQSDTITKLVGNGFFDTLDFMEEHYVTRIYAHSDWLELLHDFGLFGLVYYVILLLSLLTSRLVRRIKASGYWIAYFSVIIALLIRATFSGVYVSKECHSLFMLIGFIHGYVNYWGAKQKL